MISIWQSEPWKPLTNNQKTLPGINPPLTQIIPKQQNLYSKNKGCIFWSKRRCLKAGVPQGSVLSPILYTLYTAGIPTTTNSKIQTFADNTAVLVRHTNPATVATLLQEHITKIEKWLQDKQIKANPNKCHHITFTLRKQKPPNIQLTGTHITQTRQVNTLTPAPIFRVFSMMWRPTARSASYGCAAPD